MSALQERALSEHRLVRLRRSELRVCVTSYVRFVCAVSRFNDVTVMFNDVTVVFNERLTTYYRTPGIITALCHVTALFRVTTVVLAAVTRYDTQLLLRPS